MGDLVVRIVGDTQDFVRKVDQAGRKMSRFDRDMKRIAQNMIKTGKALTLGLTLPILGIAAAAIKVAGDFETSMNRVRAVTGATAEEMQELEAVARDLGATTQFSAKEAADGMAFLAQAGFEVTEIVKAMPGVLNLAAAAQIDMAQAADIASNVLAGFGLDTDELSNAVDIMAKTFTSSNTDLVQLGDAMKFVAPISSTLGISIEETSAAIGLLSDAGVQGQMAGTGLRQMMLKLIRESGRLGITLKDSAGDMLPLSDILRQIEASGVAAEERLLIMGTKAGPALELLLSAGGDALAEFTKELENAGGTAERIAQIQMEGLNGALKRFRSTAEEAGISIGNILIPKVMDLLEAVRGLFERFNALDDSTQRMILTYAAMVAAIGPLLIITGKAILAFKAIRRSMALLNIVMAANPVILLTLGIAALVAGIAIALPAIINMRRRHKEYQDQLNNTTEAVADLTAEQQRNVRQQISADLSKSINEMNDFQQQLFAAEKALAAVQDTANNFELGHLEIGVDIARRKFEESRVEFERYRGAINELDDILEANFRPELDLTTDTVEDLGDAIAGEGGEGEGGLVRGVKETTEAVRDLAAAWVLHRAANAGVVADLAEEARARVVAREKLEEYHAVVKDMSGKTLAVVTDAAEEIIQQQRDNTAERLDILNEFARAWRVNNEELQAAAVEHAEKMAAIDIAAAATTIELAKQTQLAKLRIIESTTLGIIDIISNLTTIEGESARESAIREKAFGLASVAISTAIAIMKSRELGPLLGIPAGIEAALQGIIQAGIILSTPLPALAQGGIVTGPTPAMVGEGGQPEIIFPLDQLGDFLSSRGDFDDVGGGATSVTVNLDGAQILKYVGKATDDGRLLINQRAVV